MDVAPWNDTSNNENEFHSSVVKNVDEDETKAHSIHPLLSDNDTSDEELGSEQEEEEKKIANVQRDHTNTINNNPQHTQKKQVQQILKWCR